MAATRVAPRLLGRLASCALLLGALLALPALAQDTPELHDCGKRTCGEWKEKGPNTCRTCKTPQCKQVEDGEALAGQKTETECYEGHGPPPEDDE